jgi:hypothetical protein
MIRLTLLIGILASTALPICAMANDAPLNASAGSETLDPARENSLRRVLMQASESGLVLIKEPGEATTPPSLQSESAVPARSTFDGVACQDFEVLKTLEDETGAGASLLADGLAEELTAMSSNASVDPVLTLAAQALAGSLSYADQSHLLKFSECGPHVAIFALLVGGPFPEDQKLPEFSREISRTLLDFPVWLHRRVGLQVAIRAAEANHKALAQSVLLGLTSRGVIDAAFDRGDPDVVYLLALLDQDRHLDQSRAKLDWLADRDHIYQLTAMALLKELSSSEEGDAFVSPYILTEVVPDSQLNASENLARLASLSIDRGQIAEAYTLLSAAPDLNHPDINRQVNRVVTAFSEALASDDPLEQLRAMDGLLRLSAEEGTDLDTLQAYAQSHLSEESPISPELTVQVPSVIASASEPRASTAPPPPPRSLSKARAAIATIDADLASLREGLSNE